MVCHTNTLYSILNGDSAGQIKRMLIRLTSYEGKGRTKET